MTSPRSTDWRRERVGNGTIRSPVASVGAAGLGAAGAVAPPALACWDLAVDVDGRALLEGVSLAVEPGEWVTVVGPNGAGKSTLLRALAGLVRSTGRVELGGDDACTLDRRARARRLALVPQVPVIPPGCTVADYVLLGRTPHLSALGAERPPDLQAASMALQWLDLTTLSTRLVDTLSGGERQRVLIARALAQEAPILLLDEPTTALDVGHQQEVLELVDCLRRERSLTVVSTMHDLTLAGQYAERLVLLDGGCIVAEGGADAVLTEETLARYYGARVRLVRTDGGGIAVVPLRSR